MSPSVVSDWKQRLDGVELPTSAFVDGAAGETFACISPISGAELCQGVVTRVDTCGSATPPATTR